MQSLIFIALSLSCTVKASLPLVVNTWAFTNATQNAWNELMRSNNPIDALVEGCRTCQTQQCDFTVGYGGSPDENGQSALDAMIFDGTTMNMGAVGNLRQIKDAIGVARHVLAYTSHSFLVGSLASDFAVNMGFPREELWTNYSKTLYDTWKSQNCQPNFWMDVTPDCTQQCGPYYPKSKSRDPLLTNEIPQLFSSANHDTIGMIVINSTGYIVAGTSTNGANHKIPGRVGDSPIPGAGAYADSDVGAAVGTGDGDVMMRFLPSFLAVERMREGETPSKAAHTAIRRIAQKYPGFFGGIVAVDKNGQIGAACNGMDRFPFSVIVNGMAVVEYVKC